MKNKTLEKNQNEEVTYTPKQLFHLKILMLALGVLNLVFSTVLILYGHKEMGISFITMVVVFIIFVLMKLNRMKEN